ncbi:MAG: GNAT family N-acetyltransferase [Paracoccaceae bacterium]|nr:GNAT family N-acetyltransferase [Paracoccaceae bacterium]
MTPAALAALHVRSMTHASPWSAAAFAGLLAQPGVFLLTPPSSLARKYPEEREKQSVSHGAKRHSIGFALGRLAADEAELLTLAVDPAARRCGIGRGLLGQFEAEARARGATAAFLEVADDNAPALALYRAAGWAEAGRRPGYYLRAAGDPANALILRKSFGAF